MALEEENLLVCFFVDELLLFFEDDVLWELLEELDFPWVLFFDFFSEALWCEELGFFEDELFLLFELDGPYVPGG